MNPDRDALTRLIAMLVVFSCWAALIALAACRPLPEPVSPPAPAPSPDPPLAPDPGPAATSCERAAQRYALVCANPNPTGFIKTCEGYSAQAGSSTWNAGCMETAADCDALWRCRGGQ